MLIDWKEIIFRKEKRKKNLKNEKKKKKTKIKKKFLRIQKFYNRSAEELIKQ